MAECKKMMELVSAYVDGECSEEETAELKEHLDECASCRALLAFYESISEDLFDAEAEPPATLKDCVMERIRKEPIPFPVHNKGVKTKKFSFSAFIKIAAAAACIALVIYAAPRFFNTGKNTAGEPQMYARMDTEANASSSAVPSAQVMDNASARSEEAPLEAPEAAPAPADGGGLNGEQGESVSGSHEGIMVSSAAPTPLPSAPETGTTYFSQSRTEEGVVSYYATITITGELPEVLAEYDRTDAGDGTFRIVIPADIAKLLIEDEYAAEITNENAAEALVIYSKN